VITFLFTNMRTLLVSLAFLTFSLSLWAQSAPLPCDGRRATVRISDITAAGSVKGFMDAVAAHRAWFFSHGLTKDEITTVPVIVRDDKTKARSYSDKQFLSIHIHGSAGPEPKHDEAYDAFVKMYRDNSDIKYTYDVCLPDNSFKK
jgi:hypothetical protein